MKLCAGRWAVGAAIATFLAAAPALAWDHFGHMVVAAAAYKRLTPATRRNVARLLKLNPRYANWVVGARRGDEDRMAFMRAATWADSIKADPLYQDDPPGPPSAVQNSGQEAGYADTSRHAGWHYVNQPFSPDGTALVPPAAPNLATQLPVLRAALAAPATGDDVKSYDLVWLLHLVGDAHQPLHTVARFDAADRAGDRGGNAVKIGGNVQPAICDDPRYCPFGPPRELHAFYDTILGSGYAVAPAEEAAARLPAPDAKLAAVRDEAVWMKEGLDLSQRAVYAPPIGAGDGPFQITPEYQKAAEALGRQRMALAGARLANLLNDALGR